MFLLIKCAKELKEAEAGTGKKGIFLRVNFQTKTSKL